MRPYIYLIFIIFSFGCTEKPELKVALSIDYEGCSDEELETVFELIERHNATATFFVTGKTAETNPESVRGIYSRNYSLGLHTYYHNFPIFDPGDAELIASVYDDPPEYVWNRSLKTEEAFYEDIVRNRAAVMEAVGNATTPTMFRCPSLVINWTSEPAYFEVLDKAGIEIDSSIYQDFSNPRAHYTINGVLEVPVAASDFGYQRTEKLKAMTSNFSNEKVPLTLFFHPHNIKGEKLSALDSFLDFLEENYEVEYLKIEDVRS
jgi:peptidoglycan/xylan/chitin deacetylase (PgdA/CDA1 family)